MSIGATLEQEKPANETKESTGFDKNELKKLAGDPDQTIARLAKQVLRLMEQFEKSYEKPEK